MSVTSSGYGRHLFEYRFGDSEWGIEITAKSPQEARERLNTLTWARYKGEIAATFGFGRCDMTLGLAFWILMLLWLVFGMWQSWPNHYVVGGNLLLFILLLLLGWKVFGAPIHG